MIKILSVFGTRPEAIKMAILAQRLNENTFFDHRVCVTGQHREMLDQVLAFFDIETDYDLDLMRSGQDLIDITSRSMTGLREVYKEFSPDMVLVHGDTSTCLSAALSAFYMGIKVAHVEAGLRTGNLYSPFPEEANRTLVGKLAYLHFAPTQINVDSLIKEGVPAESIVQTGNTVIDSLMHTSSRIDQFSPLVTDERLIKLFGNQEKILLITGHRRENFGDGFEQICDALHEIAIKYPDLFLVYPVHLNPNVAGPVRKRLSKLRNVILTNPLQYSDFVFAMKNCWAILTDSGGIQEEAPSLGKPVLVMRDTTERPEAVEAGTIRLVGANKINIVEGVSLLKESPTHYSRMSKSSNPYGDGKAVDRIIDSLESEFSK
jgi:UDP-N-acetylglucosamine 2-epimerase (non-hydrolysing)